MRTRKSLHFFNSYYTLESQGVDINEKSRINEIKFEHGILMNDIVSDDEKVVCRDEEINKIIETLLRHKKNIFF